MVPSTIHLDEIINNSYQNENKPYFKNLKDRFQKGKFVGNTYLSVWTNFPEHIEWLILNYNLIIDKEEFEKIENKSLDNNTPLVNLIKFKITNSIIEETATQEPFKTLIQQLPTKKFTFSNTAIEKLNSHKELIEFNRKKNLIREEWRNNQEKLLTVINGVHQFTEEFKKKLMDIIVNRGSISVLNKINTVFCLLGITVSDIDTMAKVFDKDSYNKQGVSLLTFLLSCIQNGCGDYYHITNIQFDKETLSGIKNGEIKEVVVTYKLANNNTSLGKEILNIDNEFFFIEPTSRKIKKDGVNYGKIYLISKFKESKIIYNWFDYNSQIDGRIDTLLSVECYIRNYLAK